jgi:hypothetical protein
MDLSELDSDTKERVTVTTEKAEKNKHRLEEWTLGVGYVQAYCRNGKCQDLVWAALHSYTYELYGGLAMTEECLWFSEQ